MVGTRVYKVMRYSMFSHLTGNEMVESFRGTYEDCLEYADANKEKFNMLIEKV